MTDRKSVLATVVAAMVVAAGLVAGDGVRSMASPIDGDAGAKVAPLPVAATMATACTVQADPTVHRPIRVILPAMHGPMPAAAGGACAELARPDPQVAAGGPTARAVAGL